MNTIGEKIKVTAAFVVIVGVVFWVINTTRPQLYNASDLNFEVGSGAIIVTNPSGQSIPVQFMGTGTRTFRVSSDVEGISGNSTRGSGVGAATHLFEFELPTGTSEFFVRRGTDVRFVAIASTELQATVYNMTANASRNTFIVAIVVILGSLFYASHAIGHNWIYFLTGNRTRPKDTTPTSNTPTGGQGQAARAFGDNRKYTKD